MDQNFQNIEAKINYHPTYTPNNSLFDKHIWYVFYSLIGSCSFSCPIRNFYTFHIWIKPGFHSSHARLKHVFYWFLPKVTSWKHQKSDQITNNSHHAWCQAWLPWKHGWPDWFPLFFSCPTTAFLTFWFCLLLSLHSRVRLLTKVSVGNAFLCFPRNKWI